MFGKVIVLMVAAGLTGFGQIDPKGIFVTPPANDDRPAVKYSIRLSHHGEVKPVASSYHFQSGDHFQFIFETSRTSYVYLLQRELVGDPDAMQRYVGSKGIVVVRDDDNKKPPASAPYHLLWPANGENVRLEARRPQTIPIQAGLQFEFDNQPGLEKIVLVVSPKPMDLERDFPGSTRGGSATAPPAGKRNDSDDDVLAQLRKDLDAMDRNTASAEATASKGICVGECASYSAPRNPANPFLVVIDLRHFQ
jgi:hypothetical protein